MLLLFAEVPHYYVAYLCSNIETAQNHNSSTLGTFLFHTFDISSRLGQNITIYQSDWGFIKGFRTVR